MQTVRRYILQLVLGDEFVGLVRARAPVPALPHAAVTRPAAPRPPRRPHAPCANCLTDDITPEGIARIEPRLPSTVLKCKASVCLLEPTGVCPE